MPLSSRHRLADTGTVLMTTRTAYGGQLPRLAEPPMEILAALRGRDSAFPQSLLEATLCERAQTSFHAVLLPRECRIAWVMPCAA